MYICTWYKQTSINISSGMAISYENIHSVLNNVLLDSNIKSHTLYPQKIPCTPKLVELGYMYPQMKKNYGYAALLCMYWTFFISNNYIIITKIITNDWLVCFIFHWERWQNNYCKASKGNMPVLIFFRFFFDFFRVKIVYSRSRWRSFTNGSTTDSTSSRIQKTEHFDL